MKIQPNNLLLLWFPFLSTKSPITIPAVVVVDVVRTFEIPKQAASHHFFGMGPISRGTEELSTKWLLRRSPQPHHPESICIFDFLSLSFPCSPGPPTTWRWLCIYSSSFFLRVCCCWMRHGRWHLGDKMVHTCSIPGGGGRSPRKREDGSVAGCSNNGLLGEIKVENVGFELSEINCCRLWRLKGGLTHVKLLGWHCQSGMLV